MIEVKARTSATSRGLEFKSLRELTLERLRTAILSGEYAPGEWLKERTLARELGVSTTPVKDALRSLEYEGLVVSVPLHGSRVVEQVEAHLAEMSVLRTALEGVAAFLAATKADAADESRLNSQLEVMRELTKTQDVQALAEANSAFHEVIHEIAENAFLHQMLEIVRSFDRASRLRALANVDELARSFEDHETIAEAIGKGQPDEAERRMREHVQRAHQSTHKGESK